MERCIGACVGPSAAFAAIDWPRREVLNFVV
jgi:hypothetical protein